MKTWTGSSDSRKYQHKAETSFTFSQPDLILFKCCVMDLKQGGVSCLCLREINIAGQKVEREKKMYWQFGSDIKT